MDRLLQLGRGRFALKEAAGVKLEPSMKKVYFYEQNQANEQRQDIHTGGGGNQ